jgi:glutamine synthetase
MDLSPAGNAVLMPFLAGVLRAARDLTAIWAPTVNSYVRLRTAPFSPRVLRWGPDDRTAAVRLAGRDASQRLEFRFAGADAQVHLVVAALLAAGLSGIEDQVSAPEPGEMVGQLAGTPWEALRLMEASPLMERLLGRTVTGQQAAFIGAELTAVCESVSDIQRKRGNLRA